MATSENSSASANPQENQPAETPRSELAQKAREHYDDVSNTACSYSSVIPEAINVWEREPEMVAACKAILDGWGHQDGVSKAVELARTALTKVKGGSQ